MMTLSDHLRPLLRDHDCVIIPDFGGLVAETIPARVQPGGRHLLSPPTRQVAFNQALTRNDGLLVDALREHLGLPAAEAREALRQAVAALHHELQSQHRTELPGIGVFRQSAGRGLQFEYTGTDNLLAAAFGLPELTAHPVAVLDARLAREQQAQLVPRLRSAGRGLRLRRVVPGATIGLLAGLAVAGLYLLNLHPNTLPTAWQGYLPRWEQPRTVAPQQAALAQPSFSAPTPEPVEKEVLVLAASPQGPVVAPKPVAVATAKPAAVAATRPVAAAVAKPAAVAAKPVVVPVAPGQTVDPVDALLAQRIASPLRPRAKGGKVPAAAAIALADNSNIAKPVPLALRKPGTAALTTSYAAAATAPRAAAPAPVAAPTPAPAAAPAPAHPVVSVQNSKAVTVAAPKPGAAHTAAPAPAAAVVPAPVAAAAPATATTIKARTGRYYLVVVAYSSWARAEQGRLNLAHAGRPAKVILPPAGSRLYRLSAVDFPDYPSALAAAAQLRQNPHFDKGLTVYPY